MNVNGACRYFPVRLSILNDCCCIAQDMRAHRARFCRFTLLPFPIESGLLIKLLVYRSSRTTRLNRKVSFLHSVADLGLTQRKFPRYAQQLNFSLTMSFPVFRTKQSLLTSRSGNIVVSFALSAVGLSGYLFITFTVPCLQPEVEKRSPRAALALSLCGNLAIEKYSLLSSPCVILIARLFSLD